MIKFNYYFKFKSMLNKIIWKFIFSKKFKFYGQNVNIYFPENIIGDEYISIEDNVYIGKDASILVLETKDFLPNLIIEKNVKIRRSFHAVCINEIKIAEDVLIADNVLITDNIHGYQDIDIPIRLQPLESKGKIKIGEGTWLGENVSVICSTIGKHSIIGANSVVVYDIPSYSIAVGSPAKVIKRYDNKLKDWIKVHEV